MVRLISVLSTSTCWSYELISSLLCTWCKSGL